MGIVIIAAMLSGAAAYYNMDARVMILESKLAVEASNRQQLQTDLKYQMDKVENKVDKVADKIDAAVSSFYQRERRQQ